MKFLYPLLVPLLIPMHSFATNLTNVSIRHKSNMQTFQVSWRSNFSGGGRYGKIFLCDQANDCIESASGEFPIDRSIYGEKVVFPKSFFGKYNRLVVKQLNNNGNMANIYNEAINLACNPDLYKKVINPKDEERIYGPVDLNCDGSTDILKGEASLDRLVAVYPYAQNAEDSQYEVSFKEDGDFLIDPKADASNKMGQSCKLKVLTKAFFNGKHDLVLSSTQSQGNDEQYLMSLKDASFTQENCEEVAGQKICAKVYDLCFKRSDFFKPETSKKGYDNRVYAVSLAKNNESIRLGQYKNSCGYSFGGYGSDGYDYQPSVKDGLDNNCDGNIDELGNFKTFCSKVDPSGAKGICSNRCIKARADHVLNIFRFPRSCESYNGNYPLWASTTRRERKAVCLKDAWGEGNFESALNKCNTCAMDINPSAWNDSSETIEDKCKNYAGVPKFQSRAAYTDFTADYVNCQARLRCASWKDSSESDFIYY